MNHPPRDAATPPGHRPRPLLEALVAFFREPPAREPLRDHAEIDRTYRRWRLQMLVASTAGYGFFYLTRKNISVALPLLSKHLGYSNTQLGLLGSLLYVTYGLGKLGFGLIGDRVDPRRFMAVGLILSAICNVAFGLSSSLLLLSLFWGLNGFFQSSGAPPCAKICVRWFSVSERGTKWALWNISHQAGGGVILVLAGFFAAHFGWRGVFLGPALLCLGGAAFIYAFVRDRPEELGLPPIELYRADPELRGGDTGAVEAQESFAHLVVRRVLLNPQLLMLACGSMCVYVVRYGTLDWAPKFLAEVKHQPIEWAGGLSSLIEFVGIPGMLLAGWISDRFFDARRAPICFIYLLALAAVTLAFFFVPPGERVLAAVAVGAIGFFTYGPQMLLAGVAAADTCGAQVASAAVGVTGLMSYVGAIATSLGTGALVDRYGWRGGFALWIGFTLLGALLMLPLWRLRGRSR
jgi:MFS transporter, OPA family, sugar phosphate sensor protein UhpC